MARCFPVQYILSMTIRPEVIAPNPSKPAHLSETDPAVTSA